MKIKLFPQAIAAIFTLTIIVALTFAASTGPRLNVPWLVLFITAFGLDFGTGFVALGLLNKRQTPLRNIVFTVVYALTNLIFGIWAAQRGYTFTFAFLLIRGIAILGMILLP